MNIHGNDIIIHLDGTAIAAARSCDITEEVDTIEKASESNPGFKHYRTGRKKWSASSSCLVTGVPSLLLKVGKVYGITVVQRNGENQLVGNAICTDCKITATRGNLAQGSFSFQGVGILDYEDNHIFILDSSLLDEGDMIVA